MPVTTTSPVRAAANADVERARLVVHAIVDHTLGLPKPAALPRRKS